jgi:hypothetical protein
VRGHSREPDSTTTTTRGTLIINKYVNIQNDTSAGQLITIRDQKPTHQNKNKIEKL